MNNKVLMKNLSKIVNIVYDGVYVLQKLKGSRSIAIISPISLHSTTQSAQQQQQLQQPNELQQLSSLQTTGLQLEALLFTSAFTSTNTSLTHLLSSFTQTSTLYKYKVSSTEFSSFKHIPKNSKSLQLGQFTIQPIYTPGVTIDHLCYYLNEEDSLFSGHLIPHSIQDINSSSSSLSKFTYNKYPIFSDLDKYYLHLQDLLLNFPNLQKIYTASGFVIDNGKDAINKLLDFHKVILFLFYFSYFNFLFLFYLLILMNRKEIKIL